MSEASEPATTSSNDVPALSETGGAVSGQAVPSASPTTPDRPPLLQGYYSALAMMFAAGAIVYAATLHFGADRLLRRDAGKLARPEWGGERGRAVDNPLTLLAEIDQATEALCQRVLPSVVSIDTTKNRLTNKIRLDQQMRDHILDSQVTSEYGIGSGVIVSQEGHILTNYHVVRDLDLSGGQDTLEVRLRGRAEPQIVDLVGSNVKADIAVLKLRNPRGESFPALAWGDSDLMRMGSFVFAFGSPFGLSETVTGGRISNNQRRLGTAGDTNRYLQTDCVINPGNSGGPLVNVAGELIGLNWAIYSDQKNDHSWQGVGLVIPGNDAKLVYESIIGRTTPPIYIGLAFDDTAATDATRGARITAVERASPAELAGLKPGDRVISVDGVAPQSAAEAWRRVQRKRGGERLEFNVIRDGKEVPGISLTIADASKAPETRQAVTEELVPGSRVQIKEPDSLTLALLKKKGWVRGGSFLFVDSVAPGSPFASRLQAGDVILGINQVPTAQFAALRQQIDLSRTTNQPVQLQIWRDDATTFALTLP